MGAEKAHHLVVDLVQSDDQHEAGELGPMPDPCGDGTAVRGNPPAQGEGQRDGADREEVVQQREPEVPDRVVDVGSAVRGGPEEQRQFLQRHHGPGACGETQCDGQFSRGGARARDGGGQHSWGIHVVGGR